MSTRSPISRFLTLLVALGLILPVASWAQGPCCCASDSTSSVETVSDDAYGCCSSEQAPCGDAPEDEGDEQSPCDECDCDCPGACCSPSKAPVGVSSIQSSPPVIEDDSFASTEPARREPGDAVFEISHPPQL